MRVVIENRVEQTLRHLPDSDRAKVVHLIKAFEDEGIGTFRARSHVKLAGKGALGELYSVRATGRLRIICKYRLVDRTLVIEDIVSHDVLSKWASGSG
jgi:mRNA-degrading endonuclease RelE of RelBE toxin-antitoxin system